ncbi:uncharacterized protein [Medicago truncatula]|uniref:uncharacterized protein n=1 Tax=Medicago truncatula TaxID=3880 RepID=UPI001967410B|nr:uncharacterized protein LOC120579516 [Medicago truncatula]
MRSKWLRAGDANSKFFHSIMSSRRRFNTICSVLVEDVRIEGVEPSQNVVRPSVSSLRFQKLSVFEGGGLVKPFSVDEVKEAIWDYDSYKSSGPDGLAKGINTTFIVLIPKVDNPQRLNDFRLISLVGSLYKIIAKLLANRFRLVIGSVVSDTQSAFVNKRQILDGILIANEVVDEASKFKKDLMLFKVDFEKGYDPVDWGYLDEVLQCMSFPVLWRK